MNRPQIILIIGCQRSGTSWLCSMLGAHSKINMCYESTDDTVTKYSGCQFNANKLVAHQIGVRLRANVFGHMLNRITSIFQYKIWPLSRMSINDYIKYDAKIIKLIRNKADNLASIKSRSINSNFIANAIYNSAQRKLCKFDGLVVPYTDLEDDAPYWLQCICNYIGIEFEPEMLDGGKYIHIYQTNKEETPCH